MRARRNYLDEPQQISFPREVKKLEHKVLYALWREGEQCIASLGVMTDASTPEVTEAIEELKGAGKVDVFGTDRGPFAICSLNQGLVASLSR